MKNLTGVLLCICMLFSFAACSGDAKSEPYIPQGYTSVQQETTVAKTEPTTKKATKTPKKKPVPTTTQEPTTQTESTKASTAKKIIETIITTSVTSSAVSSTSSSSTEDTTDTSATAPKKAGKTKKSETSNKKKPTEKSVKKKLLVTYFSRTGENYGVGNITKGNTTIVAEMIAEQTHADVYEIIPKVPYPSLYDDCVEQVEQEQEDQVRPVLKNKLPSLKEYDVIFIGYPIWLEDCPMPVYTFMEGLNWKGKTIVPFCTYGESGICDTESYIQDTCKGAKLLEGYEVKGKTVQEYPDKVKASVIKWLSRLKY